MMIVNTLTCYAACDISGLISQSKMNNVNNKREWKPVANKSQLHGAPPQTTRLSLSNAIADCRMQFAAQKYKTSERKLVHIFSFGLEVVELNHFRKSHLHAHRLGMYWFCTLRSALHNVTIAITYLLMFLLLSFYFDFILSIAQRVSFVRSCGSGICEDWKWPQHIWTWALSSRHPMIAAMRASSNKFAFTVTGWTSFSFSIGMSPNGNTMGIDDQQLRDNNDHMK